MAVSTADSLDKFICQMYELFLGPLFTVSAGFMFAVNSYAPAYQQQTACLC